MPTKVYDEVDFARRMSDRGHNIKDFKEYADGGTYLFERGPDFGVRANTVYQSANRWAKENGYVLDYKINKEDAEKGTKENIALRFTSQ